MNKLQRACCVASLLFCLSVSAPTRAQYAPPAYAPSAPSAPSAWPYAAGTPGVHPRIIEESLSLRITQVEAERKQLIHAGRPPYFRQRRTIGFVGIGAGAGTLAALLLAIVWHGTFGVSHDGGDDKEVRLSHAEQVLLPVGTILAVGMLSVGIWGLSTAKGDDPHRERIDALTSEYQALRKELKRAKRNRKRFDKYGVTGELALSQQAPRFVLRLQMRL